MKKSYHHFGALALAVILIGASFYYLKSRETDYDAIMNRAYKRKDDFSYLTIFDGVTEVEIPDRQMNLEGSGIDSDNNEIRDDIDIWINRMSNSFNERQAMKNYAHTQSKRLMNCLDSSKTTPQDDLDKDTLCLEMISYYERKGESFGVPMLDLLIANTEKRKKCYLSKSKTQFDKTVTLYLLKNNCRFDVKNAKGIIEVSDIYKKN